MNQAKPVSPETIDVAQSKVTKGRRPVEADSSQWKQPDETVPEFPQLRAPELPCSYSFTSTTPISF